MKIRIATLPAATLLSICFNSASLALPVAEEGYTLTTLVPGSEFCGVHGLGIDKDNRLYADSVVGQRVYRVDIKSGETEVVAPPPTGNADDMEFLPDGTMVWTSISQNAVRAQKPGGDVYDLAPNIRSVNSIAYNEKTNRLFVAQVFGGDGLWELDPQGKKAPRNIINDMGGLNGFDIGPDGMIYGPLWFKNRVVKIDPDTAEMTTVVEGFHTPAAANFDSNWNLYVLDTATGEVYIVDIKTGEKKVFVQLKSSLDNLAIDSNDQMYVSNMADNSIVHVDLKTKTVTPIVKGGLSCPTGISVAKNKNGNDTVYLADIFAFRSINGNTGAVTDLGRSHAADTKIHYPSAVASSDKYVYIIGSGALQRYKRDGFELLDEWRGIPGIQAVAETTNDKMIILHGRGTTLSIAQPDLFNEYVKITDKIKNAVAMSTPFGNKIYVTQSNPDDSSSGSLVEINIDSGEIRTVANKLDRPAGLDTTDKGNVIVMTGSPATLSEIDVTTGEIKVIASAMPVGRTDTNAGSQAAGVAVSKDAIYVINDRDNVIYRIKENGRQE